MIKSHIFINNIQAHNRIFNQSPHTLQAFRKHNVLLHIPNNTISMYSLIEHWLNLYSLLIILKKYVTTWNIFLSHKINNRVVFMRNKTKDHLKTLFYIINHEWQNRNYISFRFKIAGRFPFWNDINTQIVSFLFEHKINISKFYS